MPYDARATDAPFQLWSFSPLRSFDPLEGWAPFGIDLGAFAPPVLSLPSTVMSAAPSTAPVAEAPTVSAPVLSAPPVLAPPLFAPTVIGTGVTEAEDLELDNYQIETRAGASGGETIRITPAPAPAIGTASGEFAGAAGTYDLTINYIDEDDGVATWTLLIDGTAVGSFAGPGGTAEGLAASRTFTVDLTGGEIITIQGERDDGELARIDSIEIQQAVVGAADISVGITEFEDLGLLGYQVEDRPTAASSDANILTLTSGTATGTFTGPDGNYELDIDFFNENDGEADWTIRVNGQVVGTFSGTLIGVSTTLAEYKQAIFLETGDEISVEGVRDGGALARLDALKLTPTDPGANAAPLAGNDTGQMLSTETLAFDVLANDTDRENDPLTITAIITPLGEVAVSSGDTVTLDNGTVTLNANQTLSLNPTDGYEGPFDIEYVISDGTYTDVGKLEVDVFDTAIIPPIVASLDTGTLGPRAVALTIEPNTIQNRVITVDWQDGSPTETITLAANQSGTLEHTFAAGGRFDVTIDAVSSVATQQGTVVAEIAASGTGAGDGEAFVGTVDGDALLGDGGNDSLDGGDSDDVLRGNGGADLLDGGPGSDTLEGGGGQDVFDFDGTSDGVDRIVDFTPGVDKIRIDFAGFGGGLELGERVELVVGVGAATLNEKAAFLYNPVSGDLFFDPNGAGFQQPVLIATLEGAPAITAKDILVSADLELEQTRTGPDTGRAPPGSGAPVVTGPDGGDGAADRPAPPPDGDAALPAIEPAFEFSRLADGGVPATAPLPMMEVEDRPEPAAPAGLDVDADSSLWAFWLGADGGAEDGG